MNQLAKLMAAQKAKKAAESTQAAEPKLPASDPQVAAVVAKPEPKPESRLSQSLRLLAAKKTEPTPPAEKAAMAIDSGNFDLADLAAMDAGSIDATPEPSTTLASGYFDEIEATAPDRVLPADLTQQQMLFVESLDGIYQILHDADLFAQSVRNVMIELQENPEYIKLISDHDVHTMIRGMRNSMGMARIKKQEKSRKGGGGRAAAKSKGKASTNEALDILNSLMGDDE